MAIRDISSAGRSSVVPFIPGEKSGDRHLRRKRANLQLVDIAREWCSGRGIVLKLTNNDHHWSFEHTTSPRLAEWWPSTAKLVFDKAYEKGIHAHDWTQVTHLIDKFWFKKKRDKKLRKLRKRLQKKWRGRKVTGDTQ